MTCNQFYVDATRAVEHKRPSMASRYSFFSPVSFVSHSFSILSFFTSKFH